MSDPDHLMWAWLRSHHGVISWRELRQMGHSARGVAAMVEHGELVPMMPGVYRSAAHPHGPAQTMTAACLRNPAVAIALTTAGRMWGLRKMRDERVHVLAPHGCSPELPDIVVHRCRRIDPVDFAQRRPDGIRLTSVPRTIFDSAALLDEAAVASIVEQALAEQRCTLATLLRTVERLSHPRRPGSRQMQAVLMGRPAWKAAARSDLEVRVRAAVMAAGLPQPEVEYALAVGPGEIIRLDLAWAPWRTGAEIDHPFWHDGIAESRRDKRRDRKAAGIGWQVVRMTDWDVDHALEDAMSDIRRVLAARGCAELAAVA